MSLAIIAQQESNTVGGGSIDGYLSGSSSASADTFYGRRFTDLLINEDSTISSFTASTGGSGSASTAGQFVCTPGTYRIEGSMGYGSLNAGNLVAGLYNVTSAAFEVYTGTAIPILGTSLSLGNTGNTLLSILGTFTVSTTNKTYEIRHKASATTLARGVEFCGSPTSMTGTNVNSAAALNLYAIIKILKTS